MAIAPVTQTVERLPKGLGRLVVLALILVALSAFPMLPSVLNLDAPAIELWFLVAWVMVPTLAGMACLYTAARSAGADRRAWRSFGLGCLLWILGVMSWASYGWFGAVLVFPSLADVFFGLTSVAFVFGIYHYSLEGSGGSRLQVTNFAIAISAVLAIGFIVHFAVLVDSNLGPLGALVAFSYPVTWLGTFAFCLICFSLYVEGQRTFPFLLILAAVGGAATADVFYDYALLTDSLVVGDFYFTFWLASFVFLAWAALEHNHSARTAATPARKATRPGEALIPALSVAAILGAGLTAQWHHLGASVLLLVPAFAGFAALLAMREHAIFASERNLRARAERNIRKLAESEEQLARVLDHTTDGVIVLDRELRMTYANRNAVAMNFSDRPYLGLTMWEVFKSSPDDNEFYNKYRTALARQTPLRFEAYSIRSDRWFEDHVFPTSDGLTVFYRDVTERRRLREGLVRLAQHDPLTGLANRALLGERLEQGLHNGRRHRDLVLVLIDLDGFKNVNDTFGHLAGDRLLQQFAGRLTSLVRQGDTVARFGGDEFAIVQPGPTELEGAAEVSRRIFEALHTPFDIYGTDVTLAASIGIALAPGHGTAPDELIRKADLALYRAKRTKGASLNYCIFEPGMDDDAASRALPTPVAKPRLGALPKPA